MDQFEYKVKIPKERVAILIGKGGSIKRMLEAETKTSIIVDSVEGDVTVKGQDAIALYAVREIVKAIGRGYNPDIALLLLKQDYTFEMMNLKDVVNPSQMQRIKGRVIGKNGRTRELVEEHTDTNISVYGKTISIIGRIEDVNTCRRALEMLIRGSQHATVYRWLERMRSANKGDKYGQDIKPFLRHEEDAKDIEAAEELDDSGKDL